jgi:hypothetical protein
MVRVLIVAAASAAAIWGTATFAVSVASAAPGDVRGAQSLGPSFAPVPQAPGSCDSNYSGACVPIASDVDCAGGSGNGPAYVSGPVTVVGNDIYGLDRDGDGTACD